MKNATLHWSVQVFCYFAREAFKHFLPFSQLKLINKFASIPRTMSLQKEITVVTKPRKIFLSFKKRTWVTESQIKHRWDYIRFRHIHTRRRDMSLFLLEEKRCRSLWIIAGRQIKPPYFSMCSFLWLFFFKDQLQPPTIIFKLLP